MSTRQRKSSKPLSPPAAIGTNGTANGGGELPPKRRGKVVRHDVAKPFENIRLTNLVYILVSLSALLMLFYTYRITQYKAEVGGWWNLLLGKKPPQAMGQYDSTQDLGFGSNKKSNNRKDAHELGLEDHISSMASILDMQPTDLASAISAAVSEHIAPKSASSLSSSVSASASAAGASAPAVDALFNDANPGAEGKEDEGSPMDTAGRVAQAVEAVIGFDEPIMAD